MRNMDIDNNDKSVINVKLLSRKINNAPPLDLYHLIRLAFQPENGKAKHFCLKLRIHDISTTVQQQHTPTVPTPTVQQQHLQQPSPQHSSHS